MLPGRIISRSLVVFATLAICGTLAAAQKKTSKKSTPAPAEPQTELARLRDEYIKATKSYKESLEKLLALYQTSVKKAEQRRDLAQKLFAEGLMSKRDLDAAESAVTDAGLKVTEVQSQMGSADTQIAQTLVEIESEKELAKLGRTRRGSLLTTTSFIRYNGAGHWLLSQASTIESFFQETFHRPLPIAVFGQGAIHNQWHLDHRNAMDVSLNPDGAEGQALINFLQHNGIPFSAFRTAIPGVATGPHIHIGMPSHRY